MQDDRKITGQGGKQVLVEDPSGNPSSLRASLTLIAAS
jgi:hypothetical protein